MKLKWILLLLLNVVLVVSLFVYRDAFSVKMFSREAPFSNISHVAADASGAIYTITDSKRMLHKIDRDGELVYDLSSHVEQNPNSIQLFNHVIADEAGNAYVLLTILDSFGLRVVGEQILMITPDGADVRVIYRVSYPAEDDLFRVGKIQSLYMSDGSLYFYKNERNSAGLYQISTDSQGFTATATAKQLRTIELPDQRLVSELTGHDRQTFFFTSKQGRLYAVTENQEARQLYPAPGKVQLNFPVEVYTPNGSKVYFIDYHESAVQAIDAANPAQPVQTIIRLADLISMYPEQEWSDFSNLSSDPSGNLVIGTSESVLLVSPDGVILDQTGTYRYPMNEILKRTLYWLLLIVTAVTWLISVRAIYIHGMKRKISLILKQLVVIVPIILVAMVGISFSVYTSFSDKLKDEMRGQLELLAGNGKYLVNGADLEQLNSPLDYDSPAYREIKQRMNDLFRILGENRDGFYSTLYRYMDGNLYIITDDDDSVTMFRPFPTNEENLQVLLQGAIVSGEWEDATGQWLYALGPLYSTDGEIIGIYETGKDMIGVERNNLQILSNVLWMIAWIGAGILVVVTLMTIYLLSSLQRLRRSVNRIASGDWDTEVLINTRDEVAELGERFNMMARSIRQYIREVTSLSESYFRFVPQQFLQVLGKTNMTQVRLGDQVHRRMNVLVCNLRQFSDLSASMSPEDNFRFINSFLRTFGPMIRSHGGFTSRYLGPGMLALFANDATDAIKAALTMRANLLQYNEHRNSEGYRAIDFGISIHIGDVMIGIIGEEQRMESSVVSDQVRIAQEIEKVSDRLGSTLLLTAEALATCRRGMNANFRRLGAIQLYGEPQALELIDLYEGDTPEICKLKQETKNLFESSVELYRNGRFVDAREGFVAVIKKNRWDLAAKLYFYACDQYSQQGVTADWNGSLRIS